MKLFNKLNISTKIIIPVILLLVLGNIVSTYLSSKNMHQLISQNSEKSLGLLTDSIFMTLREAMNSGDPKVIKDSEENIKKTLAALEDLTVTKSQKLIDMYSPNETLTKNKNILEVIDKKTEKLIHIQNSIQIIRPMLAKKDCLTCHPTHKIGETIGVISLTFSLEELTNKINHTVWLLILSASFILIVTIIILFITTKKAVNPLDLFSQNLKDFFKYLNGDIKSIEPFKIIYEDEIGAMVKDVNLNIEKTTKGLEQDKQVIKEASDVINKVKSGFCSYTINSDANNKGINELKDGINDMVITMKHQLDEILNALIEYGNANFDYKVRLDEVGGDVGSVIMGTKTIAENISELFATVLNSGENLSYDIEKLSSESIKLETASSEQTASIEQTASAILQISSNMQNSSQSVANMSDLANKVTVLSDQGTIFATQTAQSMEDINIQVNAINDSIAIIDQIAFQTNILSLNAAVEAATAGEAGKGFAVVAGEVRNLATRSSQAASQIKELVEKATIKSNQGKSISDKMIVGYSELNEKISQTKKMIDNVSNASKEQQNAVSEVNVAVEQLNITTQQNATTSSHMKILSQDVKKLSNILIHTASDASFDETIRMQVCDNKLTNLLNSYKLDHIHLKDKSFSNLNNCKKFDIINHHECKLGIWMDEEEKSGKQFTKTSNWNELKEIHKTSHDTIQKYIDGNANKIDSKELYHLAIDTEKAIGKTLYFIDQIKVDYCKELNS